MTFMFCSSFDSKVLRQFAFARQLHYEVDILKFRRSVLQASETKCREQREAKHRGENNISKVTMGH